MTLAWALSVWLRNASIVDVVWGLGVVMVAALGAWRGVALSLGAHRGTNVVGEMGTGMTFIGAAVAYMAGFKRILVLCPPHLVPKWKPEVTVPGARAAIVKSITDLERLRFSIGSGPLFAVMSREQAKLSYRWQAAVVQRWATSGGRLVRDEETGGWAGGRRWGRRRRGVSLILWAAVQSGKGRDAATASPTPMSPPNLPLSSVR